MDKDSGLLGITTEIVVAHLANNKVAPAEVPDLVKGVYRALSRLNAVKEEAPAPAPLKPAVSIRSSVKPDYLVSLESGRKMKMLKRYLMQNYGMTPDDYRNKWNLPEDYPMVAPDYSARRRALAVEIGLGRLRPKAAATASSRSRSSQRPS